MAAGGPAAGAGVPFAPAGRPWYGAGWFIIATLVLFFPLGLILMWAAGGWSLRTKRAVTGTFIFPVGAYFLWRYTRLRRWLKVVAAAVAVVGLFLLDTGAGGWIWLGLSLAFLAVFLAYSRPPAGEREPRSEPFDAAAVIGRALAVEEARSAPERRLLLAREFVRAAGEALDVPVADVSAWPSPERLAVQRRGAELLLASATDTAAGFLPETKPDDPLTSALLTGAIMDLTGYIGLLQSTQRLPRAQAEQLRVVVRERSRVQTAVDQIVQILQS